MGKYLIIKNADFSTVSVENVHIQNKNMLTPIQITERAINSEGIIEYNSNQWSIYYIPIKSGVQYYFNEKFQNKHYHRLGITASVPAINMQLNMLVNQTGGDEYSTLELQYSFTADTNGYLVCQVSSDVLYVEFWEY